MKERHIDREIAVDRIAPRPPLTMHFSFGDADDFVKDVSAAADS